MSREQVRVDGPEPGDDFKPTDDNIEQLPGDDAVEDGPEAGTDEGKGADDDIDLETLAAIADDGRSSKTVPHARFHEVNEERNAHRKRVLELEEELARAKGGTQTKEKAESAKQADAYDFDEAEDRFNAALLDGDTAKARQIRSEIRTKERAEADARADAAADKRYAQNKAKDDAARAETEKSLAIAKAYEQYPFLDHEGSEPNNDAIEEVIALTNLYVGKGKTIGEALTMATSKVGPRYAKEKPVPAAKPGIDIEKQLDRAGKVPPKPGGVGTRAEKPIDVSKMTREQFKKLTPEQKAALEGN